MDAYFKWKDIDEFLDWKLKKMNSSLAEMQKIGIKKYPRETELYFADNEEISKLVVSRKSLVDSQKNDSLLTTND